MDLLLNKHYGELRVRRRILQVETDAQNGLEEDVALAKTGRLHQVGNSTGR
jgi:hypothetical protein